MRYLDTYKLFENLLHHRYKDKYHYPEDHWKYDKSLIYHGENSDFFGYVISDVKIHETENRYYIDVYFTIPYDLTDDESSSEDSYELYINKTDKIREDYLHIYDFYSDADDFKNFMFSHVIEKLKLYIQNKKAEDFNL